MQMHRPGSNPLRQRMMAIFATLALLFGAPTLAVVVTAGPAVADTGGYPYSGAANCSQQFGQYSWCVDEDGNGSYSTVEQYSPYGYSYRNCTDYVAWKVDQVFGVSLPHDWGNAEHWETGAEADGYSLDSSPQVGDIAQWDTEKGGGYGHVAYVYAVNSGVASLAEYNVAGTGAYSDNRTTVSSSAGAPDHYIHIGTVSGGGSSTNTKADTVGIVRNYQGAWQWNLRVNNAPGSADAKFTYGLSATDIPVAGDWNGNGSVTPGIVRNVNGAWQWNLRTSNTSGPGEKVFNYGVVATDTPVAGDWNGNGSTTPGIVRNYQGAMQWNLQNQSEGGVADLVFTYGYATDTPIVGDWAG